MSLQVEEFSENRAVKENLIETKYRGRNAEIKGTSGGAYLNLKDNQWFYKPEGGEEFYRVDGKNLSCNEENGWVKCEYTGANKLFGLSKTGKAYFDEVEGVWFYKPSGGKELFRVKDDGSLRFARDKDVV